MGILGEDEIEQRSFLEQDLQHVSENILDSQQLDVRRFIWSRWRSRRYKMVAVCRGRFPCRAPVQSPGWSDQHQNCCSNRRGRSAIAYYSADSRSKSNRLVVWLSTNCDRCRKEVQPQSAFYAKVITRSMLAKNQKYPQPTFTQWHDLDWTGLTFDVDKIWPKQFFLLYCGPKTRFGSDFRWFCKRYLFRAEENPSL